MVLMRGARDCFLEWFWHSAACWLISSDRFWAPGHAHGSYLGLDLLCFHLLHALLVLDQHDFSVGWDGELLKTWGKSVLGSIEASFTWKAKFVSELPIVTSVLGHANSGHNAASVG